MSKQVIPTRTVRRGESRRPQVLDADICVLGAGISGVSAALEAAKLGRKVVLVDGAPAIGGQAIGSIIGTIIGLYSHGPHAYQLTHGIADDLLHDLRAEGSISRSHGSTVMFQYDEVRLGRWMEMRVAAAGIDTLLGAVLTDVSFTDRHVQYLQFATRFGSVRVRAKGFVDSSGDAAITFGAGLDVREPTAPVYGSLNFLIEGFDGEAVQALPIEEVRERLKSKGAEYGLVRHDGWLIPFPGKGFMLANINHIETPLDPLGSARMVFGGRRQADAIVEFLRAEFPAVFAAAKVRAYGNPGIRQTRWIVSRRQLTVDDIRSHARPADAVARCAWWVELHDAPETVYWERFPEGHVYYIPLGCMIPRDADNIVAAGRCVDADTQALSAIRVMGPCIAMGAAAAHALSIADGGAVHAVDLPELQASLHDNLERTD
jgi:FAD dependent oxidoreductase